MPDIDRLDLYLQWKIGKRYTNTEEENLLVEKFTALHDMATAARDCNELANPKNVEKWRKAYYGTLNALDSQTGNESTRKSKQLRKLVFELVESKIDNNIPRPKMKPKYKSDLPLVETTENYLKYEIDNIFTKYVNDRSERSTYVDGTSWYKVSWDSLTSSHNTSGNVRIDVCLVDQIVPQPGILDYRQLEYIFEKQQISLSKIYDLTGRLITAVSSNTSRDAGKAEMSDLSTVTMVTCYYLNNDRIVGRFAWAEHSMQVIFNERDWQIRKLRTCNKCKTVVPEDLVCPVCGSKSFTYKNATAEILDRDLKMVYNPYDAGETDDEDKKDMYVSKDFLTMGTEIPFYILRQLPFVPRPAISSIESMYGISEVFILLDMQDSINKMLTKMEEKTLKSGVVITKPERVKMNNTDETFKVISVKTDIDAKAVTVQQIMADTSQDMISSNLLYDSAKASSGVTDSFQGKKDATATSGKAKEFSALQTAGRIESLRVMKSAAFAGLYDLVLKYLLAFSDENRKFLKVLPDGNVQEEQWSKYMFLDVDKHGQIYYRDDFSFDSDPAATLSQDRAAMWQETQDKFINGLLGNPADLRTMQLFWNMMEQQQYPLAKLAIAGIKDNAQHLPPDIEQLLMQNPELLQTAMAMAQEQGLLGDNRGGARPNSGPEGNGATQPANVERTNERNRAADRTVQQSIGKVGPTGGNIS